MTVPSISRHQTPDPLVKKSWRPRQWKNRCSIQSAADTQFLFCFFVSLHIYTIRQCSRCYYLLSPFLTITYGHHFRAQLIQSTLCDEIFLWILIAVFGIIYKGKRKRSKRDQSRNAVEVIISCDKITAEQMERGTSDRAARHLLTPSLTVWDLRIEMHICLDSVFLHFYGFDQVSRFWENKHFCLLKGSSNAPALSQSLCFQAVSNSIIIKSA